MRKKRELVVAMEKMIEKRVVDYIYKEFESQDNRIERRRIKKEFIDKIVFSPEERRVVLYMPDSESGSRVIDAIDVETDYGCGFLGIGVMLSQHITEYRAVLVLKAMKSAAKDFAIFMRMIDTKNSNTTKLKTVSDIVFNYKKITITTEDLK